MAGRRSQSQMRKLRINEANSKAWVVEEDEHHPDVKVAARAVDAKAYHARGETPPWEVEDE